MSEPSRNNGELETKDLDKLFEKLQEIVSAIVRRMNIESPMQNNPFVYGLQIKVSSDGEPHIQEFGDLLPSPDHLTGKREPLTDISESEDEISITIEIPGVLEEQIEIISRDTKLIISVDSESVEYYKEIDLGIEIVPESITTSYVNGVLDITAKKLKQPYEERKNDR